MAGEEEEVEFWLNAVVLAVICVLGIVGELPSQREECPYVGKSV